MRLRKFSAAIFFCCLPRKPTRGFFPPRIDLPTVKPPYITVLVLVNARRSLVSEHTEYGAVVLRRAGVQSVRHRFGLRTVEALANRPVAIAAVVAALVDDVRRVRVDNSGAKTTMA